MTQEPKDRNRIGRRTVMVAGFYLLGLVFLAFLPETQGRPLPED